MRRSGFIVRFVDVVLILLFGFVSISSLRATNLDLPESAEIPPAVPEREEIVFVAIDRDGAFLLDQERVVVRSLAELERYLGGEIARTGPVPVKVRIRAAHDAPMGVLLDVAHLCDELGVAKAFEVRLAGGRG